MKASPRQQQLLLDLQDLDNSIARLGRRRSSLPERAELQSMQGEAGGAKDAFMAVQREIDTQQAEIDRIESDIETVRQRIRRDNELLLASSSPKEAQALQGELDALGRRQADLEERELELLEVNEQTKARFSEASEVLGGIDQRRQAILDTIASSERRIDAELEDARTERAGLAAEIQRDLLAHYETLRGRLGVGAARLRGRISEASNMELAPAELSDILAAAPDEIIHCPQTGAILVRVADDTV